MARPPDEPRFYMTYARSRPTELVPWIEANNVPLLENALHRWSPNTESFKQMWTYETPHVIDAGGYNVMSSFVTRGGELDVEQSILEAEHEKRFPFYPWTLEEYHEFLSEHENEFEWATIMDYACQASFDTLLSKEERIELTFDATVAHYELLEDSGADYELLPLLQGRSLSEYINFYERLEDAGIPADYVGVGSIADVSDTMDLVSLEVALREQIGVDALHGFGATVESFNNGVTFETVDSQAWVYHPSNGRVVLDCGDHLRRVTMPNNALARKVTSFKHYYSYVTRLQQGDSAVELDRSVCELESDDAVRNELAARVE